jgi:hypothetical protein
MDVLLGNEGDFGKDILPGMLNRYNMGVMFLMVFEKT